MEMKKNRLVLLPVLLMGLIGLTSCNYVKGVFNDDDMGYENIYNPPSIIPEPPADAKIINGVTGKTINNDELHDVLAFKNVGYAENEEILNTYKTGGVNENEFNVNNNENYPGTTSGNNYDLYVPNSAPKNDKHTVILFIHGGAWISGFKTDVNPYIFEFANRGYITATIKYTLLRKEMDDPARSIFRNLDEIDACIKSIKSSIQYLGFDTSKTELVIGGASSGAHLTMLYAYSRGNACPLPIKFLVDAVGPVNIKSDCWKKFGTVNDIESVLDAGLDKDAIQDQRDDGNLEEFDMAGMGVQWNEYQTMRIANGMCGTPYSQTDVRASTNDQEKAIVNPNAASTAMTKVGGGEDQLSVTYWINTTTNRFPIICAYAGKDSIVGINQYATLQITLDAVGIKKQYVYFRNSDHSDLTKEKDETHYNELISKVANWCDAASI